jgi:hypothetical protein
MLGEGHVEGADLVFPALTRPTGTRYGSEFNPAAVVREVWGSVRISGSGCSALRVDYDAQQAGWGKGRFDFSRLTTPLGAGCAAP